MRATSRTIRRTISSPSILLAAAIVAAVTGCAANSLKPTAATTATGTTAANSGAAPGVAAPLVKVHDPGKVTGNAPATCHALPGERPDPTCTPGAIDPAVTHANIQTTICRSGYTTTVRPPASATDKLKRAMYASYGISANTTAELDHLVSLELGGANDAANLWPEVGPLPNPKDTVENDLHKAVCSGKVTLAAAQQAIASNWQNAETALGIAHK